MRAFSKIPLLLCITMLVAAPAWVRARGSEIDHTLLSSADAVVLGDSAASLARKLAPGWQPVRGDNLLGRSPFREAVAYTNGAAISE
jgi:hypothetical protein